MVPGQKGNPCDELLWCIVPQDLYQEFVCWKFALSVSHSLTFQASPQVLCPQRRSGGPCTQKVVLWGARQVRRICRAVAGCSKMAAVPRTRPEPRAVPGAASGCRGSALGATGSPGAEASKDLSLGSLVCPGDKQEMPPGVARWPPLRGPGRIPGPSQELFQGAEGQRWGPQVVRGPRQAKIRLWGA